MSETIIPDIIAGVDTHKHTHAGLSSRNCASLGNVPLISLIRSFYASKFWD